MTSEWPVLPLGELCSKIGSGATPRGGGGVYVDEGTALVRSQNVHNALFKWGGLARITDGAASQLAGVTVNADDVLVNITGDSVARVCQAPADLGEARVNQHVAIVRPNPERLDAAFLAYWLITPPTQRHLLQLASGGATRKALTKSMLQALQVPVPTLPEQARIAGVLTAIDKKSAANDQLITRLQNLATAEFERRFSRRDFEPTPLRELVSLMRRGIAPKYTETGGVLVLNQKCVRDQSVTFAKARRHDPAARKVDGRELQVGDVLVNSTGVGTLGRIAEVRWLPELTIADGHLTVVRADPEAVVPEFLRADLLSREPEIEALGEGSTGQTELSRERLGNLPVRLAPPDEQASYAEFSAPLQATVAQLQQEHLRLQELKDALLPSLMSGRLTVAPEFLAGNGANGADLDPAVPTPSEGN